MNSATIEALEEALRQAMLASDVATLDSLIADDMIFTTQAGELITKEMDLNAHRSRTQRLTMLDGSEQQIRQYGDTAVVSVRMELAGTFAGHAFGGAYRYTRVWLNRGERWQVIAAHVSPLAA